MSAQEFIEKANIKHNFKYDYTLVEYKNSSTKVCIICPIHGKFWQTPNSHLCGRGCKMCGIESSHNKAKMPQDDFIKKALNKHNNYYSYSNVKYINNRTKIIVTCPKHGDFYVTPYKHLYRGDGCPKCRYEQLAKSQKYTTDDFINKANRIHNFKYDYSKTEYVDYDKKVIITCPIHGDFLQTPDSHLQGCGCQKCANHLSSAENEIYDFIVSLVGNNNVIRNDRTLIKPLEIDIFIPTQNIAFEFNGLRWHTEQFGKDKWYHINKTLKCQEKGISLYHIYEDEYINSKEVLLNKIKHILKYNTAITKIGARKCNICEINKDVAKQFMNQYNIQGFVESTVYLGCFCHNEIVGVMSFLIKPKETHHWIMNSFATNYNYLCQGVGGKLFTYFTHHYNPLSITAFADRRWVLNPNNNLYTKIGFDLKTVIEPNCEYVFQGKMKRFDTKVYNNDKCDKIWNCGFFEYIWNNE